MAENRLLFCHLLLRIREKFDFINIFDEYLMMFWGKEQT